MITYDLFRLAEVFAPPELRLTVSFSMIVWLGSLMIGFFADPRERNNIVAWGTLPIFGVYIVTMCIAGLILLLKGHVLYFIIHLFILDHLVLWYGGIMWTRRINEYFRRSINEYRWSAVKFLLKR